MEGEGVFKAPPKVFCVPCKIKKADFFQKILTFPSLVHMQF